MAECENCGQDHGKLNMDKVNVENLSIDEQKVIKLMTDMFMEHHDKLENLNGRVQGLSAVMMIQQITIQSLFLAVAELKGVPDEEIQAMAAVFKEAMSQVEEDLEGDDSEESDVEKKGVSKYQEAADNIAKKLLDF